MSNSSESRFPENVKDYMLLELISDGVYRARCDVLDEIVTVKIVDLEKSEDDVETMLKQVHPEPYCSFSDDENFWIVMPYVPNAESPIAELAADNSEKQENNGVLTSEMIHAGLVSSLPNDPAQIIPMLQNLLLSNETQRQRLMGLMHLYDPTAADNTNLVENTEAAGQISTAEADLSLHVQYLQESVKKLEEELEDQKKANAQLEEEINRLTKNSDA